MNEDIMESFLLFLVDKNYFSQLRCLRLMNCKNVSSAWQNINQWINFILTRISEHQLTCVRFDFIEKEHEITDLQTGDEIIVTNNPPCIVDIHRFVQENHVALWMERKQK
jgi:DNA primase large subunit